MRIGTVVAAMLLFATRGARAQPDVRTGYAGASFGALAGAGVENFTITTVRGDVFAGDRLSPWVSLEGLFAYDFATQRSYEPGGGGICTGANNDTWHWESFGARLWIHLLHLREIDLSIGPRLAVGISGDRVETPTGECYWPPRAVRGWSFDGGLDFGVEVRAAAWFGLRMLVEGSMDLGEAGSYSGFGALSVSAEFGPVFRF